MLRQVQALLVAVACRTIHEVAWYYVVGWYSSRNFLHSWPGMTSVRTPTCLRHVLRVCCWEQQQQQQQQQHRCWHMQCQVVEHLGTLQQQANYAGFENVCLMYLWEVNGCTARKTQHL
jgi:hypothetical protein